jgi:PAS domain S-box-containing protein
MVPPTDYGWGFVLFMAYFILVIIALSLRFWKAAQASNGVQKAEIQFLQMGCATSFIAGIVLLIISEILGNQELSRFVPLSVLALDGFVTYGIATRRIMSASSVLQRVVAYVLMTLYLIGLYVLCVWLGDIVFLWIVHDTTFLRHLFAALVLAFSVAPAHGWMQAAAHRLFASTNQLNIDELLHQAGHLFQEVLTENELAEKFSALIRTTFGTRDVRLLPAAGEAGFCQSYPPGADLRIGRDSPVVNLLNDEHEPFTQDTLERMRPTPLVNSARKQLESCDAAVFLGLFLRKELKAVMLLGSKKSGRIYDLRDQRALQMLADQLAVALENANLYTAVQNAKIYNETLIDSMASGIAAVDADRMVTVFNRRAQDLTGLSEREVTGRPLEVLPAALAGGLTEVLETETGFRDRDMTIEADDEEVVLRVSGSLAFGHDGKLLGALLVFTDMTLLKKLEEQIRRADRLASIGTLAAGMAHEIKNPLVTIKTFTQLLPEQHENEDFQRTFFELVGQEVQRIDAIVNRLLNFSRPAKVALKPVSLHEVIENALRLVERELVKENIRLESNLSAVRHIVEADSEQLNQTLINLFLNAVHAMEGGGTLSVRTSLADPQSVQLNGQYDKPHIQLDVRDTGCGISADKLDKIFDPFYTTKETGVGLGLSVTYGIIQEHHGYIDVESEEGRGTVFHILLPLLQNEGNNSK